MVDVKKTGPWSQARKLLAAVPRRLQAAFDKALMQEAQFLRTKIVDGIREQAPGGRAFAPLAPTTLAIRQLRGFRGTKALLVQGDLRNSITVVKDGDRVLVGVLRTARNRAGKSLVDIAALHEHGSRPIVLRLTPRARAFLHAAFRHAGLDGPGSGQPGTGVAIIQIPARPFLAPVFDKYAQPDQVSRRFLARVAALLGGDFGGA
jgi:phage gpG-like protein